MDLVRGGSAGSAAFDIAVSHALLLRVARGELAPLVRLYRPQPTVAFGRGDRLRPDYAAAGDAARRLGFEPVLRLAGGQAAAYDAGALIYEEITAEAGATSGIRTRFADVSARLAGALEGLGVDARVGEIPGEYCPGDYSISVAGRVKVAGVAQRVVGGAALVSAVVVVSGAARIRRVLVDVHDALGLAWDPATVGAVGEACPGVRPREVEDALVGACAPDGRLVERAIEAPTLRLARALAGGHRGPQPSLGLTTRSNHRPKSSRASAVPRSA